MYFWDSGPILPLPPLSILPLPGPLGLNPQTILTSPVTLHVTPRPRPHGGPLIIDDYGREIVSCWPSASGGVSQAHDVGTPEGLAVGRLRLHPHGVVQRFLGSGGKPRVLEAPDGSKSWLAQFEPEGRGASQLYSVHFANLTGGGGRAILHMRGSLRDLASALVMGSVPVVLFRYLPHTGGRYTALVAPGADLVWIAAIISCIEVAMNYDR